MADRYLITFDIRSATNKDYDDVLSSIVQNYNANNISSYCRINSLTTTYAIKSNHTIRQILNMFHTATNKHIDVIVVKVIDSDWSIATNDANTLTKHKF